MNLTAIFTIAARNYLPRAQVLMNSVRDHAPQVDRFVVLSDGNENDFFNGSAVVSPEDLKISNLAEMKFSYNLVEFCTAIKPFACRYFIAQGYKKIIYMDPDIRVYSRLDQMLELLDKHSLILVPHISKRYTDRMRPNEQDIQRVGTFNLGYLAIKDGENTRRLLDWWSERTRRDCVISPNEGIFVDQKWMELAPSFVSDYFIQRDPGWNVAYWNLHYLTLTLESNRYLVNGRPLCFFHFSGFKPEDRIFSIHQNRYSMGSLPKHVDEICFSYESELKQYRTMGSIPYGYGTFSDGTPIHDMLRRAYRSNAHLAQDMPDLTDPGFRKWLHGFLNEPAEIDDCHNALVTRVAFEAYRSRPDLCEDWPNPVGSDAPQLARWYVAVAHSTYDLPIEFVEPIVQRLAALDRQTGLSWRQFFHRLYHKTPAILRKFFLKWTSHSFRTALRRRLLSIKPQQHTRTPNNSLTPSSAKIRDAE
ncbi:hypothetical protein ACFL17_06665 [Pseudomonadota bacterium]